jgi:hypothetical protein
VAEPRLRFLTAPAALVGIHLDFAYVTLNPFDAVSEPVRATVTLQ